METGKEMKLVNFKERKIPGLEISLLNEFHADAIPHVYIPAFTSHPWHEEFECSCGKTYSFSCSELQDCKEAETNAFSLIESDEQICSDCGRPLSKTLKPIYTHVGVKQDFLDTMKKKGFIGVGAFLFGDLRALCWGYDFPTDHPRKTGSTWYFESGEILREKRIRIEDSFYHNESCTKKQNIRGLGTLVLSEMLRKAQENGKRYVIFRTINKAMLRCYEKAFDINKGELTSLFKDPNPNKRQEWYVLPLR